MSERASERLSARVSASATQSRVRTGATATIENGHPVLQAMPHQQRFFRVPKEIYLSIEPTNLSRKIRRKIRYMVGARRCCHEMDRVGVLTGTTM